MKIEQLNEKVEEFTLRNGLKVYVYDDENLSEYNANYTTYFGSNDLNYQIGDKEVELPHGIAHFLEHVMFASADGDLFNRFSDLGASANAYTSYNQTSYIFSTAINVKENLKVLTDLVQTRYFTDEVVAKEMGIITEEIIMYDQMPEWRLRNSMYEAICQSTNYKIDIAGTVETINQINPVLLNEIFDLFYVPENQVLTISGNFADIDIKTYLESIQLIDKKEFKVEVKRTSEKMDHTIETQYESTMKTNNVVRKVQAFKMPVSDDLQKNMEYYFSLASFQKAYFTNLNSDYNEAKQNDIINDNIGITTSYSPDLAYLSFTIIGEEYIDKTSKFIKEMMFFEKLDENMLKYGLRRLLASEIKATDNKADFVESVISCHLDGISMTVYYDVLFEMNERKVRDNLRELFAQMQEFSIIMNKE